MNDLETVYSTVQEEADRTHDFSLRDLVPVVVVTFGFGLVLLVVGALL